MSIKAIETRYAGCRFRSRLEARWAVFFDHLGVKWEYEAEGVVGDGGPYLPDFWLPDLFTRVEVKGSAANLDLDRMTGVMDSHMTRDRILILGPVPKVASSPIPVPPLHWMLRTIGEVVYATEVYFGGTRRLGFHLVQYGREHLLEAVADASDLTEATYARWATTTDHILACYTAARSARFEHGEAGGGRPVIDDGWGGKHRAPVDDGWSIR